MLIKCKFEKDTQGIYILPLLGYSNVKGLKSFWVGWLWWLWTFRMEHK
jgi:hypothetical protein